MKKIKGKKGQTFLIWLAYWLVVGVFLFVIDLFIIPFK